ncbi:MAG: hypothetical protein LBJ58_03990 [Tannerellaceae bacterium]|jgi:hypothetical protein|nr:hypothetical protein [Tannerellaceae bacterium]
MKQKTISFSIILIATLIFSCCWVDEDPLPTPGRTVIVYMAADNSLNSYSYDNIKDMVKGAGGENLNNGKLLVYHDSASEPPRLINIKKGASGEIEQEIVRTYEDRNSVDVGVMRSVLADIFNDEDYRSDSYGLVLWSHGTAWLPADVKNYLRSYGQDETNYMEIYDLKEALKGYTFDFIIFDDCYMANIEVAYTLRDNTGYILASPTEVLADGLPYHYVIKYMFEKGNTSRSLKKIASAFYSYYNEQLGGSNLPKSASTALVETAGLDALAAVCREILMGKEEDILNLTVENIQLLEYLRATKYHALYDFADFIKQLATPDQYARFEAALENVVVYKETTDVAFFGYGGSGSDYGSGLIVPIDKERFCGISVYVPQRNLESLNEWYKRLDWYKSVYE